VTSDPQLLIDGDLYAYQAAVVSEYEADWGDGCIVLSTNLDQAKEAFTLKMEGFKQALWSEDLAVIFSGRNNFRYSLTSTYKSNRKGTRKPLGYGALVDWIREQPEYKATSKDCLEADDYLGILSTKPRSAGTIPRIIVSGDKDMQTIPGQLFYQGELRTVTEDEAEAYWMIQTLTGDTTDGYKGCPGIGAVNAAKIVTKAGTRWENVRLAFLKAGLTEDDALLQARLARILRYEDWDATNQSPILWTPPITHGE